MLQMVSSIDMIGMNAQNQLLHGADSQQVSNSMSYRVT